MIYTNSKKLDYSKGFNYKRFTNNIFEPEKITVDNVDFVLYLARFSGLYDLYDYVASNPNLNREVFRELHSETGTREFAGKPYKEAVQDLINDYNPEYEEFLELQKNLNNGINMEVHKYKTIRTLAGGHLNIPAYSAGSPLCYESEQRIIKPKFLRIHVALGYPHIITKSQVLNRAIIITNILKSLENAGYNIDLDTFSLSREGKEIIHIVVKLKNYGESLNMMALYKTLCNVEFFRRVMFRVKETIEVNEYFWGRTYGKTCDEKFVRKVLNFDNNDIYIEQPDYIGVYGKDLAADFERTINHLNLADKIDVEKAKREFKETSKKLLLKR